MRPPAVPALCLAFALPIAGCALAADDTGDASRAVLDHTPEGVGLLRLLNEEATTFELLDDDARLDRRAAANLIAHRDGPDGYPGTGDDNRFDSIDEVDAVKYVGPAALARLLTFSGANGYVPQGDDPLGIFDGVTFTVDQAAATLALVNEESDGVLGIEIGLDRRAVASAIGARPIATVHQLAGLYWWGPAMLTRIRDHIDVPVAGERADCRHNGECPTGERCGGIPFDGSSDLGKCHIIANTPGAGDDCRADDPCDPGLVCTGLTMGWTTGFCFPDWMEDTFANDVQRFIPQDTPVPVATSVVVRGQASVPMDLVVDLELAHDQPHALKITLVDPNGSRAVLWDGPSEGGADFPSSFVALGEISRDDNVNGRWLLQVTNETGKGLGNLHGWTLYVTSRFD